MRPRVSTGVFLAALGGLSLDFGAEASAPLPPSGVNSLAPLIRRIAPGIVGISTERSAAPNFSPAANAPGVGSGVIVDARQGYILTNAHLLDAAKPITVILNDGRKLPATLTGSDELSDLAVLKVAAEGLRQIELGASARVEIGDFAFDLANPSGQRTRLTSGTISATGDGSLTPEAIDDFMQTEAIDNGSESGGALFNLRGELIGINADRAATHFHDATALGLAVPSDTVRVILAQLERFGSVRRGQLGVTISTVTPEMGRALGLSTVSGAMVSEVVADSSADKAGIHPGDIITAIDAHPISSTADLQRALGIRQLGESLQIGVMRDSNAITLKAVLSAPPAAPAAPPR